MNANPQRVRPQSRVQNGSHLPLCPLPRGVLYPRQGLALSSDRWNPGLEVGPNLGSWELARPLGTPGPPTSSRPGPDQAAPPRPRRFAFETHLAADPRPGLRAAGLHPPAPRRPRSWKFELRAVSHSPFFSSRVGCAASHRGS